MLIIIEINAGIKRKPKMRDGTLISNTAVVPARATNAAVIRLTDFPKEKFIPPIYLLGIDDSGKPKKYLVFRVEPSNLVS
jgi:hypothetical protein